MKKSKKNQTEVWREINGFDGKYHVSSLGSIKAKYHASRSGYKEKILIGSDSAGYRGVFLYRKGRSKFFYVHRLVACHFIGSPRCKKDTVNHIDGIKKNNSVENLEWCTYSYNNYHAYKIKLKVGNGRKLCDDDVRDIVGLKKRMSYKEISALYNVSPSTIVQIFDGRTWRQVTGFKNRYKDAISSQ